MQDNAWSLGLKCARVFENNCRGSTAEVVTFRTVLCQPGAVEALRRPQAEHGSTESGRPLNISLRIPSDNPPTRPHSACSISTPLTSASIPLPHSLDLNLYLDPATALPTWTLSE
ncbi:hypothetical protein CROQUDRAFT_86594 [Cronartium quercuum f. sp. fusiforme G11]|uniref:Uncharacterized protein n=1 Tax=Cronartium quercuum f. sp. fusiforme G11 TaxID=708437 RepID=A0A9P6TGK5_9BASI|nr:hypothetical protein CROQUDRAFT_86594 [Cronartium quercuum f. sp. fusiforme G11]